MLPKSEEIRVKDDETGGEKGVKAEMFSLIPVYPLWMLATVYGLGAEKYDLRNWEKGYPWSRSYDALQRHLNQFWAGEDLDEDGVPHLSRAAFHCFALLEWTRTHPELDDRVKHEV